MEQFPGFGLQGRNVPLSGTADLRRVNEVISKVHDGRLRAKRIGGERVMMVGHRMNQVARILPIA